PVVGGSPRRTGGPLRPARLRRLLPGDIHRPPAHRRLGRLAAELRGPHRHARDAAPPSAASDGVLRGGEPRRDPAPAGRGPPRRGARPDPHRLRATPPGPAALDDLPRLPPPPPACHP